MRNLALQWVMLQLVGRTFSGIFTQGVEIKQAQMPGHIHIITNDSVVTIEDQIIESKGAFQVAK